jgi:hypothetical protein
MHERETEGNYPAMMTTIISSTQSYFLSTITVILLGMFLLPSVVQASIIERNPSNYTQSFIHNSNSSTQQTVYTGKIESHGTKKFAHHTGKFAPLANHLMLSSKGLELGGTTHSPAKKLVFSLSGTPAQAGFVRLELDGLYGVSTTEAHELGQQASDYVSSPTTLKINGVRFQHFTLNTADTIVVDIPVSMLKAKGFNIIQLEAGYFFDENNALAYDEVSTGSIRLIY